MVVAALDYPLLAADRCCIPALCCREIIFSCCISAEVIVDKIIIIFKEALKAKRAYCSGNKFQILIPKNILRRRMSPCVWELQGSGDLLHVPLGFDVFQNSREGNSCFSPLRNARDRAECYLERLWSPDKICMCPVCSP